jgi:hypothetical protein
MDSTPIPDPAHAGRILEAMRAEYPLMSYQPSPTQLAFHTDCTPNKLITTGGRGGKTTSCMAEVAWLAMGTHPHKQNYGPISVLVLSVTRQNASQVAQKKLYHECELPGPIGHKPFIPGNEVAEYGSVKSGFRTYYQVRLRNGSVINHAWSDDPKSWLKAQGAQYDLIVIDEARCTARLLRELDKRLWDARSSAKRGDKPPWAGTLLWGATGTENSRPFEDFRRKCMDPSIATYGFYLIKPGETGAIDTSVLAEAASHMTLEEREIHIEGTRTAAGMTNIYGQQWDDARHMLPVDHIPSPMANLHLGWDPGARKSSNAMAIKCVEPTAPHHGIMVKFFLTTGKTLDHNIALLRHWLRGRRLATVCYDNSADTTHQHADSLMTVFQQKMNAFDMAPLAGYFQSKKGHYYGIMKMREAFDPDHYDKTVRPLLQINPSEESGGQIFRFQALNYQGKEETRFTGPGAIIKKDDDALDSCRYLQVVAITSGYNADWACGRPVLTNVPIDLQPVMLPDTIPRALTWEEQLIERSKAGRTKARRHLSPFQAMV